MKNKIIHVFTGKNPFFMIIIIDSFIKRLKRFIPVKQRIYIELCLIHSILLIRDKSEWSFCIFSIWRIFKLGYLVPIILLYSVNRVTNAFLYACIKRFG